MITLDLEALRPRIDLEGKYVDFSVIRTALTVERIVGDLGIELSGPTDEGECRGSCPKCRKDRSFALNVNTNRFNCFAKGCLLKGGGVIDFVAKLFEVPAKEASHLLARAYGISPYSPAGEDSVEEKPSPPAVESETGQPDRSRKVVSREEFDELSQRVERLSYIVWSLMFESGEVEETEQLFDDEFQSAEEKESVLTVIK